MDANRPTLFVCHRVYWYPVYFDREGAFYHPIFWSPPLFLCWLCKTLYLISVYYFCFYCVLSGWTYSIIAPITIHYTARSSVIPIEKQSAQETVYFVAIWFNPFNVSASAGFYFHKRDKYSSTGPYSVTAATWSKPIAFDTITIVQKCNRFQIVLFTSREKKNKNQRIAFIVHIRSIFCLENLKPNCSQTSLTACEHLFKVKPNNFDNDRLHTGILERKESF